MARATTSALDMAVLVTAAPTPASPGRDQAVLSTRLLVCGPAGVPFCEGAVPALGPAVLPSLPLPHCRSRASPARHSPCPRPPPRPPTPPLCPPLIPRTLHPQRIPPTPSPSADVRDSNCFRPLGPLTTLCLWGHWRWEWHRVSACLVSLMGRSSQRHASALIWGCPALCTSAAADRCRPRRGGWGAAPQCLCTPAP